ncbi:hypothetical protein LIPSTDRAFT_3212 [Lipomyces starkeyi NRRL Y-11557]|uniref:Uncharacterized protein n=1 Tax=Lipomyces starkeyi NRRL Y-11557 TaxID=675824 RepID=A0A1E3Q5A8_LIPST|nr:hypothetical protein LIPSTDRAFT_3212 [Lipomyces starkeyi NRRL Y-11557]
MAVDILSMDLQQPIARGTARLFGVPSDLNGTRLTQQRTLVLVHDILVPNAICSVYAVQTLTKHQSITETLTQSFSTHNEPLLVAATATLRKSADVSPTPVTREQVSAIYVQESGTLGTYGT